MKPCQLDRLDQWRAITIIERIAADHGVPKRDMFDWQCKCPSTFEARQDAVMAVARVFPHKPVEWFASVFLCYQDTIRHLFYRHRHPHPGAHNPNAITKGIL